MYPHGLVGNCQSSALIHPSGSVEWFCAPRPDSPPIFGKILDSEGGEFSIAGVSEKILGTQRYLPNTNVLETTVASPEGVFRITDFFPRYEQHGRMYRPVTLIRIVTPVSGTPRLRVRCRPVNGWSKEPVPPIRGNAHLRFDFPGESLRLLTSMPLTHLCDETEIALTEKIYFALSWGSAVEEDLQDVCERALAKTIQYWQMWVKHCSIPSLFQRETIRSALALKLHCYEDTGAILASVTSSLPEEPGGTRNWDYRFCWPRDSYFTLSAFHNLGHFEEMEGFLKFLLRIAQKNRVIQPVYRVDGTLPLPELTHPNWEGHLGGRPVRSQNEAATHVQNDVYGELILALAPIFLDERFQHLRTPDVQTLIADLALQCSDTLSQPDAGLWELRGGWREHTFTNLMCWAGLDRAATLKRLGFLPDLSIDVVRERERAEMAVRKGVQELSLRNGPGDGSLNAALFLAPLVRFPDVDVCETTVQACYDGLKMGDTDFLFRYRAVDDFGVPQSAFVVCSFWWIQALALTNRREARAALERVLRAATPLGLLSEHFDPVANKQLGNFPQTYSHVGLINSAFAVSPPWSEVL